MSWFLVFWLIKMQILLQNLQNLLRALIFKPQSGNEMSEAKMLPKMPLGGCRKCKDEAKKSFDVIFMIIVSLLATFFSLFLCE